MSHVFATVGASALAGLALWAWVTWRNRPTVGGL